MKAIVPTESDLKEFWLDERGQPKDNTYTIHYGSALLPYPEILSKKLEEQIYNIQGSINLLTNRLDTVAQSKGVDDEVTNEINKLRNQFAELTNTSKNLTARVVLPPSEELEVKLITTNSLDRLEEYRSNQNIWAAGFGLFGGAVMGILVNFVTGAEVEKTAWVLVVAFLLVTGIFAYFFYLDNKRIESAKAKFFQHSKSVKPE